MAAINLGRTRRATFHDLTVADVRPLTESSVEVTFAVPDQKGTIAAGGYA